MTLHSLKTPLLHPLLCFSKLAYLFACLLYYLFCSLLFGWTSWQCISERSCYHLKNISHNLDQTILNLYVSMSLCLYVSKFSPESRRHVSLSSTLNSVKFKYFFRMVVSPLIPFHQLWVYQWQLSGVDIKHLDLNIIGSIVQVKRNRCKNNGFIFAITISDIMLRECNHRAWSSLVVLISSNQILSKNCSLFPIFTSINDKKTGCNVPFFLSLGYCFGGHVQTCTLLTTQGHQCMLDDPNRLWQTWHNGQEDLWMESSHPKPFSLMTSDCPLEYHPL